MKGYVNLFLACCSSLLLFCCCDSYLEREINIRDSGIQNESRHKIPKDVALSSLEQYLKASGDITKSSLFSEASLFPVTRKRITTKGNDLDHYDPGESLVEDTVMYVVNMVDGGYAIFSADDRIPEEILAVTDSGYISMNDFTIYCRDVVADFAYSAPVDAVEECSDSDLIAAGCDTGAHKRLINPYEFDPYDVDSGDYYVSSLGSSEDVSFESESGYKGPFIARICMDYVESCLDNEEETEDEPSDTTDVGTGNIPPVLPPTTDELRSVISSSAESYINVDRLLKASAFWQQESPYNQFSPRVRKYLLFGKRKRADAGCGPLAIARTVAYNRYPQLINYNSHRVNWNNIYSSSDTESAAALIRLCGAEAHSLYTYSFTATLPSKINSCYSSLGYRNVQRSHFDENKVIGMLNDDKPIVILAIPRSKMIYNLNKAHIWNIDGYKTVSKIKYREVLFIQSWRFLI